MDNLFDLPLLPPIDLFSGVCLDKAGRYSGPEDGYTTDKMLAYARAAVEAEREACAKLCKDHQRMREATGHPREAAAARKLAEMIQQRGKS